MKVSQYQDKGVIPLTGDVEAEDQKAEATDVAAQPAPGYAISNELGVRPVGREGQAKRDEAQKLAKARPKVKEVINKIQGR